MAPLKHAIVLIAVVVASPVHAETIATWQLYIREASSRFAIPEAWIERVMHAESGGRTSMHGRPIRSSAGAIGLMQLMPGTWAETRARLQLGSNPDDPRDNILAGTYYLRLMYDRFGYPGLYAAYNAGPARYAEHLADGRPLPSETVGYLASVAPDQTVRAIPTVRYPRADALFAVRKASAPVPPNASAVPSISPIFVALSRGD